MTKNTGCYSPAPSFQPCRSQSGKHTPNKFRSGLLLALSALSLMVSPTLGQTSSSTSTNNNQNFGFVQNQLTVSPTTVGARSQLTIISSLAIDFNYVTGDKFRYIMPPQSASFVTANTTTTAATMPCVSNTAGVVIINCQAAGQSLNITINVTSTVAITKLVLTINNFQNPGRNDTLFGILGTLTTPNGSIKAAMYNITMSGFTGNNIMPADNSSAINGTFQNGTAPPPPPPLNGTNSTMNGTNSTMPPPMNGTNGTMPPPQNSTNGTMPPPMNGTNGTQNGTMPPPMNGTNGTQNGTMLPINGTNGSSSNFTQPPVPLNVTVIPYSPLAYDAPARYLFWITPNKTVPQFSSLTIELPLDIDLAPNYTVNAIFLVNDTTDGFVNITRFGTGANNSIVIRINDMFNQSSNLTSFPLMIDGLRNPRSMKPTGSFKVSITDPRGALIQNNTQNLTVIMDKPAEIQFFNVTPSSPVNGAIANWTINVTLGVPVFNGDFLQFDIPQQIQMAERISCNDGQLKPQVTINCTKLGNSTVRAVFTNKTGVQIIPARGYAFNLNGLRNPSDNTPVFGPSNITFFDANSMMLSRFRMNPPMIQTLEAAFVRNMTISQSNQSIGAQSNYTIKYSVMGFTPSTAAFRIQVPNQLQIGGYNNDTGNFVLNCVILGKNQSSDFQKCDVDTTGSSIYVFGGMSYDYQPGEWLAIQFGPVTNPSTQKQNNDTFKLVSFTDMTFQYQIDKIANGLGAQLECDYPCKTCQNRTQCLSCLDNDNNAFLARGQCLPACPNGTYADSMNRCVVCPQGCKTCSNPKMCNSCSGGLFLSQNQCQTACPLDQCANKGVCSDCKIPNFGPLTFYVSNPQVNANSTLRFNVSLNNGTFATNDSFIVGLGFPGVFLPNAIVRSNTTGVQIIQSSVNNLTATFRISVSSATITRWVVIDVSNFQNPQTAQPIQGIFVQVIDANLTLKAQTFNGVLAGFSADKLRFASVSLIDQQIGARENYLIVNITTKNDLSANSSIEVRVPQWNPLSAYPMHSFSSDFNHSCIDLINIDEAPQCSYDYMRQILVISSINLVDLPAGSNISISISGFNTPYTTIPRPGFMINTIDGDTNSVVDSAGNLTLAASQPIDISDFIMFNRVDNSTTVGELSTVQVGFNWSLPLDAKCVLRIIFPEDMPTTNAIKLGSTTAFMNMKPANSNASNSTNTTTSAGTNKAANQTGNFNVTGHFVEIQGCSSYSDMWDNRLGAIITLINVTNKAWVDDTRPFKVEFYALDNNGQRFMLGQTDIEDPRFIIPAQEFTQGTVNALSISSVDTQEIGQQTRFRLRFNPQHAMPYSNQVRIGFPNEIPLSQTDDFTPCMLMNVSGGVSSNATCYVELTTNELIIDNIFGQAPANRSFFRSSDSISFVFGPGGQNPKGLCHLKSSSFQVSTWAHTVDDILAPIDAYEFNPQTIDPQHRFEGLTPKFTNVDMIVTPSSLKAADRFVQYDFEISSNQTIPMGSEFWITFPGDITLIPNTTGLNCVSYFEGGVATDTTDVSSELQQVFPPHPADASNSTTAATNQTGKPMNRLVLRNILPDNDFYAGTSIFVSCSGDGQSNGIVNPRQTGPSGQFQIQVIDANGCINAQNNKNITINITSTPSFDQVNITSDNSTNGALSNYKIDLVSTVDIQPSDVLFFKFPQEVTLPSPLSCFAPQTNGSKVFFNCTSPQKGLLRFARNQSTSAKAVQIDMIPTGQPVSIVIPKVKNSGSTQPTSAFDRISIQTAQGNLLAVYNGGEIRMINTMPTNTTGSLTQLDKNLNVSTEYTINFVAQNQYPQGASIMIAFPPGFGLPDQLVNCSVTVGTVVFKVQSLVDPVNNTVSVFLDGTTANITALAKVAIKMSPITNPNIQGNNQSLQLATFTDKTQMYVIDVVMNGLVNQAQCDYPCATCDPKSRSTCKSCLVGMKGVAEQYLLNGKCVAQCTDGTWNNNNTCQKCPSDCKTCSSDKVCLSCDLSSASKAKYMNNSRCYASCNKDSYFDATFTCQKCDKACGSCSISATNCTACPTAAPLLQAGNATKVGTCVSSCESNQVNITNVCKTCTSPCSTCLATVDQCLTCTTGYLSGTKCYASCPSGFKTSEADKKCLGCDVNCKKCSTAATTGATTYCTLCKSPMVLLGTTCVTACPTGYKSDGTTCKSLTL